MISEIKKRISVRIGEQSWVSFEEEQKGRDWKEERQEWHWELIQISAISLKRKQNKEQEKKDSTASLTIEMNAPELKYWDFKL